MSKKVDPNYDRFILMDYRNNPDAWAIFLFESIKPGSEHFVRWWTGAKEETRAAVLKSAGAHRASMLEALWALEAA